ncbi:MAG: hemerythrin domain-containing protein [Bacillota bacterium]|nr:hemerythrin domain-containing protein [Bacillota bacterium]
MFIETAVDFMRFYADKCHHGKEEDILFNSLVGKPLTDSLRERAAQLTREHVVGRRSVGELSATRERYLAGDSGAVADAVRVLERIAEFYPDHIKREDAGFFIPLMDYYSKEEQDKMLEEFWEYDRMLIHEKYRLTVEGLLAKQARTQEAAVSG